MGLRIRRHELRLNAVDASFCIHVKMVRLRAELDLDPLPEQRETAAPRTAVIPQSQQSAVLCSYDAAGKPGIDAPDVVPNAKRLRFGISSESTLRR